MNSIIQISSTSKIKGTVAHLPASKSISNRALVLDALSGNRSSVSNLSEARDTVLMRKLIHSDEPVIDVMDAGTTMRFLTAYFSLTNQHKVLTGSARMKERPIQLLVDALRAVGAVIHYQGREGYPPVEVKGFNQQMANEVAIDGGVSSQYISALMMLAPLLPMGLIIRLKGKVGSRPYIEMTASLMKLAGIAVDLQDQVITVPAGVYKPFDLQVESDWSAVSYWYAMVALGEEAEVILPNVSPHSIQGDHVIVEVMDLLGVNSDFVNNSVRLTKKAARQNISWDFTNCPDLAQTVLPVCAIKNIGGRFKGLESLRIKETDRIAALQTELGKVGARIEEEPGGLWVIHPQFKPLQEIRISTYHDHRMAMGLAPLATRMNVTIEDPDVVNKSYPGFWKDLEVMGFELR